MFVIIEEEYREGVIQNSYVQGYFTKSEYAHCHLIDKGYEYSNDNYLKEEFYSYKEVDDLSNYIAQIQMLQLIK